MAEGATGDLPAAFREAVHSRVAEKEMLKAFEKWTA